MHPGLPVIVVSPHSNVTEWLDALDGGAADYCSAPFELAHLGWILSSRQRPLAAAAA
jgi:DNA-binding NtrC family response regulator